MFEAFKYKSVNYLIDNKFYRIINYCENLSYNSEFPFLDLRKLQRIEQNYLSLTLSIKSIQAPLNDKQIYITSILC